MPQPGNPSSFDRYSYVNNNPIHNIDPSGHRACSGWDEYGNCIADIGWKPNSDFGVRTIVKEVKEIISKEFNVDYTLKQIYIILRDMGMNFGKPYPRDYRRPQNAEEILKKTS